MQSSGSRAHGLQQVQFPGSGAQAQQLWLTGSVAVWDLPALWTEHASPALASRFFTTGPRGKPLKKLSEDKED